MRKKLIDKQIISIAKDYFSYLKDFTDGEQNYYKLVEFVGDLTDAFYEVIGGKKTAKHISNTLKNFELETNGQTETMQSYLDDPEIIRDLAHKVKNLDISSYVKIIMQLEKELKDYAERLEFCPECGEKFGEFESFCKVCGADNIAYDFEAFEDQNGALEREYWSSVI